MRRGRRGLPVFVALLAAGCASAPSAPVAVVGPAEDLRVLRGQWVGEYSSSVTGRAGTIVFDLKEEGDTARGEVWMSGRRRDANEVWPEASLAYRGVSNPVEVLTIRFVRVEGGYLSGVLDPYLDPQSGIQLVTVFRGVLEGDVITGEFATTNQVTGELNTGLWKVQRKLVKTQEERR